jgi:hypothetical protein
MDEAAIQAFMQAMGVTRDQAIAALSAAYAMGGGTGSANVYLGEKVTKKGKKAPARTMAPGASDVAGMGGQAKIVEVNTKPKEDIYSEFWSNPGTQNQVMTYLQLMGRANAGKPGAYEVWKDIVDQAAEIYRGGSGPKITPYELLNMSMQGASATDNIPQRQIREYDKGTLSEIAQAFAIKNRGKKLDDAELQEALDMADKIIQKGVLTKTEQVRNPKTGKLENVSKTTGGFSQEKFESMLGKKFEEETPELVERRKAFEGLDLFQKIMAGGI